MSAARPRDSATSGQTARFAPAVLAAALDPIITIDIKGTVQSASDSVSRVLGWAPSELIGKNIRVIMPEPHRSMHDGYLKNYQHTGQTNILNRPRRFDAQHRDGHVIPIELCVSRADMPDGAPPLFVGILRDMTDYAAAERTYEEERIRSQQLLAEQTAALQQANLRLRMADRMASIGTLAAGLGHDMNNVLLPVRARLNALKAACEAGKLPAAERTHLEEIRKSVAYLQQLADGLHFLALDPETEEDERSGGATTDLLQWWSQAGTLLAKAVPKHVEVRAEIPEGLPRVCVAAHGLTQAVLNLVVNAGEAIPKPGDKRRRHGLVRVWAMPDSGDGRPCVRLGVSDNGTGMQEDVRRRAFEMFFTTKPRGLGTGLGLALVRNVAERAGGHVDLDSQVDKGTTVTMILPAATVRAGEELAKSQAVLSLSDGRITALLRHILEVSGLQTTVGAPGTRAPGGVRLWVLEPRAEELAHARAWRQAHPLSVLVLFGPPPAETAAAWESLTGLIIRTPEDLDSVRRTLSHALEENEPGDRDAQPGRRTKDKARAPSKRQRRR